MFRTIINVVFIGFLPSCLHEIVTLEFKNTTVLPICTFVTVRPARCLITRFMNLIYLENFKTFELPKI